MTSQLSPACGTRRGADSPAAGSLCGACAASVGSSSPPAANHAVTAVHCTEALYRVTEEEMHNAASPALDSLSDDGADRLVFSLKKLLCYERHLASDIDLLTVAFTSHIKV